MFMKVKELFRTFAYKEKEACGPIAKLNKIAWVIAAM